jgi:putative ABC transport system ATP-binding protein
MTALQLENVRKVYQSGEGEIVAVDRASLEVGDAEIVALVGPSGSGKTTLLSISGGLLSPSEGRVVVAGDDISGYDPKRLTKFRRESVGFVFQSVNLVPFLTARENLLVVAEFGRRDKKKSAARADQLLGELELDKRKSNLPAQLSGGERQRVAVGRAFMNEPDLVLIDEPTSALDTKLGEQVMELIVTEVRARDTAAVIVTHDLRMTHMPIAPSISPMASSVMHRRRDLGVRLRLPAVRINTISGSGQHTGHR